MLIHFAGPGNILTVADDLLKNDGGKFLEMMEQLAERRMQREEDAAKEVEVDSEEDEDDPEGSEEEDEDDEDNDDESEEEEDDVSLIFIEYYPLLTLIAHVRGTENGRRSKDVFYFCRTYVRTTSTQRIP